MLGILTRYILLCRKTSQEKLWKTVKKAAMLVVQAHFILFRTCKSAIKQDIGAFMTGSNLTAASRSCQRK